MKGRGPGDEEMEREEVRRSRKRREDEGTDDRRGEEKGDDRRTVTISMRDLQWHTVRISRVRLLGTTLEMGTERRTGGDTKEWLCRSSSSWRWPHMNHRLVSERGGGKEQDA